MIAKYTRNHTSVEVLKMRDGKPTWVGGYVFVRAVDDKDIRVKQTTPGAGFGHFTTWSHDRVRPAR